MRTRIESTFDEILTGTTDSDDGRSVGRKNGGDHVVGLEVGDISCHIEKESSKSCARLGWLGCCELTVFAVDDDCLGIDRFFQRFSIC